MYANIHTCNRISTSWCRSSPPLPHSNRLTQQERERYRVRQAGRKTESQRQRSTHKDRVTDKQNQTQLQPDTHRHRYRQRQKNSKRHKHRERQTDRSRQAPECSSCGCAPRGLFLPHTCTSWEHTVGLSVADPRCPRHRSRSEKNTFKQHYWTYGKYT